MFNGTGVGRWGEGRCFRKISNKAVFKNRIEMEQMLEAKTKQINKENKTLDITHLGDVR